MRRVIACIAVAGGLLAPIPVFAQSPSMEKRCGADMAADQKEFYGYMRKHNYMKVGDAAHKKKIETYLRKRHKEVVDHEMAHYKTAGRWAGSKPIYHYYQFYGKKYAVAGCVWMKPGIPLETDIKASLAPKEPSSVDKAAAAKAKKYLKIKKARAKCKRLANKKQKAKCLGGYRAYGWLDDYPVR